MGEILLPSRRRYVLYTRLSVSNKGSSQELIAARGYCSGRRDHHCSYLIRLTQVQDRLEVSLPSMSLQLADIAET
jgi:hypothetical protein